MSPNEYLKKYLKEADMPVNDDASTQVIKALLDQPVLLGRHEAPVGYETHLLTALRAKLPQKKQNPISKFFESFGATLRTPQMSWSISGALAIFVAVLAISPKGGPALGSSQGDLLASTASKGGAEVVNGWLASMGDSGVRAHVAGRDVAGLVHDIESSNDRKAVDRALNDVAKAMGLKL